MNNLDSSPDKMIIISCILVRKNEEDKLKYIKINRILGILYFCYVIIECTIKLGSIFEKL